MSRNPFRGGLRGYTGQEHAQAGAFGGGDVARTHHETTARSELERRAEAARADADRQRVLTTHRRAVRQDLIALAEEALAHAHAALDARDLLNQERWDLLRHLMGVMLPIARDTEDTALRQALDGLHQLRPLLYPKHPGAHSDHAPEKKEG